MNAHKAQLWLSAVSYVLITVIVIVILLNTGLPLLEKMKDKSIYTRTKDTFVNLNEQIRNVQTEGPGSQRVVPIEIVKGEMSVEENAIKWSMQSKAKIIEPRSKIFLGDLIIGDDSFITFEEQRTYAQEDFNEFSASTWKTTGSCGTYAFTGALAFLDSACATTESLATHQNFSADDGLSLQFTYRGGDSITIPTDEFYIGLADASAATQTSTTAQLGGIVFNGSSGKIETTEYDGGTLRHYSCTTYAADTLYYGKVTLSNTTRPRYYVSTDEKTWTPCPNQNSTKSASLKAMVIAVSGSASIDDLEVHDNRYHVNNSYISVDFNRFTGTRQAPQPINTTQLVSRLFSTLTNSTVVGNFTFRINDDPASELGLGYVELSELRTDPDAAVVISHVNASRYEYDLILTVEGGTDFIQVNVQNLVIR